MHNGLYVCIIFLYDENSECILHIWIYIMLPQVLSKEEIIFNHLFLHDWV